MDALQFHRQRSGLEKPDTATGVRDIIITLPVPLEAVNNVNSTSLPPRLVTIRHRGGRNVTVNLLLSEHRVQQPDDRLVAYSTQSCID